MRILQPFDLSCTGGGEWLGEAAGLGGGGHAGRDWGRSPVSGRDREVSGLSTFEAPQAGREWGGGSHPLMHRRDDSFNLSCKDDWMEAEGGEMGSDKREGGARKLE